MYRIDWNSYKECRLKGIDKFGYNIEWTGVAYEKDGVISGFRLVKNTSNTPVHTQGVVDKVAEHYKKLFDGYKEVWVHSHHNMENCYASGTDVNTMLSSGDGALGVIVYNGDFCNVLENIDGEFKETRVYEGN